MSLLVIAEHDNAALKAATLNAVTAAAKIGGVESLVLLAALIVIVALIGRTVVHKKHPSA